MKHFIFTCTAGRTGTQFLRDLLQQNVPNPEAHHEIITGFDKFGKDTPDISHFHTFNSKGNTSYIKKFWRQKLSRIAQTKADYYIETSHLLAKAGLIENLNHLNQVGQVHLVFLTRDIKATLKSLHKQATFQNIGNAWLWHLDPNYPKNLLDPAPYLRFEIQGVRLWYLHEIAVRQAYYSQILKDSPIKLHHVDLSQLNHSVSIADLLSDLGHSITPNDTTIPKPTNISQAPQLRQAEDMFLDMIENTIHIDPQHIAANAIAQGKSFEDTT